MGDIQLHGRIEWFDIGFCKIWISQNFKDLSRIYLIPCGQILSRKPPRTGVEKILDVISTKTAIFF